MTSSARDIFTGRAALPPRRTPRRDSRDRRRGNLTNVIYGVSKSCHPLQTKTCTDGDLPFRVGAECLEDPVGVLTPRHDLRPLSPSKDIEAPSPLAHRVVRRCETDFPSWQRAIDGVEDSTGKRPQIECTPLIDREEFKLVKGFEVGRAFSFPAIRLSRH